MMSKGKVAAGPQSEGERLEQLARTRKKWILGSVFAVGLIVGLMVGYRGGESLFDGTDSTWPKPMAIGIVITYLAAVIGGGIALSRHTDEYERLSQYKAVAFAALVYMLIYPIWFTLWMGDIVREPMHGPIFIAFWLSLAGASIFYRIH